MKKIAMACSLFILCFSLSCSQLNNNDNVSIKVKDTDHYYKIVAHFNKNKTRSVEKYMDAKIGRTSNMSFVNTRIDGELALDDHTTFYIKKYPGFVEIKLDKDENSDEAYYEMKSMSEGIKKLLAQ